MYTELHKDNSDVLENNIRTDVPLQLIIPPLQDPICIVIAKDVRPIVCALSDKNVDYVS